MFNLFKKPKFSIPLFVAAALATFILLGLLFISLKIILNYSQDQTLNQSDKYYFKKLNLSDPLTTKMPGIKDMLAGPIISQNDPSLGLLNAPLTIVEFSDFECKFCQTQEKILKAVMEQYEGKIRLIWKDYPENNLNSISFKAALAARCANSQDKFWEYHDLLYQDKNNLDQNKFILLAEQLNLDKKQFEQCLNDNDVKKLIKDNIAEANALGIVGIPFIYVNDQEVMGEITINDLREIIETELQKIK